MGATLKTGAPRVRILLFVGEVNMLRFKREHRALWADPGLSVRHALTPNHAARYPAKRDYTGPSEDCKDPDARCGVCWACIGAAVQEARESKAQAHVEAIDAEQEAGAHLTVVLAAHYAGGQGAFPQVAGPRWYRDIAELADTLIDLTRDEFAMPGQAQEPPI